VFFIWVYNETLSGCTVEIETADGKTDKITSTLGHKYYLPFNTECREVGESHEHDGYDELSVKWVSACNLKVGDKVLLANVNSLTGKPKYGMVTSVVTEQCNKPTAVFNFEVQDFHTYHVGKHSVCTHNTCVKSRIGESKALLKESKSLSGDTHREANGLVTQFASGNQNPGIGTKHLSGDIYYLRGKGGARVFYTYDASSDVMHLLGKASKANESRVISLVLKTFGG